MGSLLASNAMAVVTDSKATDAMLPLPAATSGQLPPLDLQIHPETAMALAAAPSPTMAPVAVALQSASAQVKRIARWVIDSRDNGGLPFLLVDKVNAEVFAFNPAGQLQGAAPALLGMARGDRLIAPNNVPMAAMPPQVRITPAGRFVSRLALDSYGKELLVLDYDASISLHAVIKGTPAEHRAERLSSATSQDNRISFGCINVPAAFYSKVVSPAFTHTKGIVYVLPETSLASDLFGPHPVTANAVSGTAVPAPQIGAQGVNARATQSLPVPVTN